MVIERLAFNQHAFCSRLRLMRLPLGRLFRRNAVFLKKNEFLSSAIRKGEEHAIKDFRPLPYLG